MAKQINLLKAGGKAPFADGGLKLSKSIQIEKIETYHEFQELFKIDLDLKNRITESMKKDGFDNSQPLHIWVKTEEDTVHYYLIDGYTRLASAKDAGLKTVPYYEHKFETFDDAYMYALGVQVNRRNLDSGELIRNVSKLLGTDLIQNTEGKKSEAIADVLGVSPRTVEKAISVAEDADEETLAKIDSGELSVNKAYKQKKSQQKKKETIPEEDDISDSLEDSDGNPHEIIAHSRDMSEQFSAPAEDEMDKRLVERYKDGFSSGFKSGWSEGSYQVFDKILALVKEGKTAEEIEADDSFADFTFSEIAPKFDVPTSDEDINTRYNK